MRYLTIIFAFTLICGHGRQAFADAAGNQKLLTTLLAAKNKDVWSCSTGSSPNSLEIFTVKGDASGLISSDTALVIQDQKICSALNITCPFVGSASANGFGFVQYPVVFWATRGRSSDTVMFFAEPYGMKVVSANNGSNVSINWQKNWFFSNGDGSVGSKQCKSSK